MEKYILICFLLFAPPKAAPKQPAPAPVEIKAIDSLLAICKTQVSNAETVAAVETATKTLAMSQKAHYSQGRAISCYRIAQMLSYTREYGKTLDYLEMAEKEKYTKTDILLRADISRVKGQVYWYLRLTSAAVQEYSNLLKTARQIIDPDKRNLLASLCYENLTVVYDNTGKPDSVFHYLSKNRKLLDAMSDSLVFRNKISLGAMMGRYYAETGKFDSAAQFFHRAEVLTIKYNYPYSSWLHKAWGDMEAKKGKADSALLLYRKAQANIQETGITLELPTLYQQMSTLFSQMGAEDSARFYHEKSISLENEFLSSKSNVTEKIMQTLLLAEKQVYQTHLKKIMLLSGSLIVVLASLAFFAFRIWRKRTKAMRKKEKEITGLMQQLNESSFDELVRLAKTNDNTFMTRFREVYPLFTQNLYEKHPDLISSEFWLCAMIFLNFSSKEIAQCAVIEHRSVQVRKSRLRKKLDLPSHIELYQYMLLFNK